MLPILFQNSELILYSYPLLMGIGWGVAYQIFFSLIPEELSTIKKNVLFWGIFTSSWVGAKILFLVTQSEHTHLITNVSFWTGGGFVFYGGLIQALLFLIAYHFSVQKLTKKILWPLIPSLCFGHGIGRIGCFLAGCCYGSETQLWWGVFLHGTYRHPTQLLEAIFLIIMGFYFLKSKVSKDRLVIQYFIFYGLLRIVIELLRGDEIRGRWGHFTPSIWISFLMIVMASILWVKPIISRRYTKT